MEEQARTDVLLPPMHALDGVAMTYALVIMKVPGSNNMVVTRRIRYESEPGFVGSRIDPPAGNVELRVIASRLTRHHDRLSHRNAI